MTTRNTRVRATKEDGQGNLVRRLLTLRSLDHGDHAIEERVAGIDRDPHDDPIRQDPRAAGNRRKNPLPIHG